MSKSTLRAITLIRPWGYAIAHLDKRTENRSWNCSLNPGDYLAIHNGKKWDEEAAQFVREMNQTDWVDQPTEGNDPAGAIIAIAQFVGNINSSNSPWFFGPIGWELENVVAIDPVPCVGKQGLWSLPDDVLQQVRENYAQAVNKVSARSRKNGN